MTNRWTQEQVDAHQAKVKRKQPEQEGAAIDSMQVKSEPMIWISRYDIIPIGKPRITARGKYGPVARKYYEFAEKLRSLNMEIPQSGTEIQFFIPMPISWSKKKKRELRYQPHRQTPDIDNLLKAVLDAVYKDDKVVWSIKVEKFWANNGFILVIKK